MSTGPSRLLRVENPIRDYAWGSPTAIPEALGAESTGRPQAEMWLGAHPGDPSILADGTRLDDYLAAHPDCVGGSSAGGPRQLPFLMKLLAAASPLSLQVHPSTAQAEAGFARDEASGLDLADPLRSYKDPFHKPEIIVALSPFTALCGFRQPRKARDELLRLLPEAMTEGVGAALAAALSLTDEPAALRAAFELVLSGSPAVRHLAAAAVSAAAGEADLPLAHTIRWIGGHHADDPGVIGAALLNRVDLAPREALYLGAGNIHAYLSGFGIEAMAPSDNVLRGGLTPKPIDIAELMDVVAFTSITPTRVEPEVTTHERVRLTSYWPPAEEFSVHIIDAQAGPRALPPIVGPSMLVVTSGRLEVGVGAETAIVSRGESLFQAAGEPMWVRALDGDSTAYLTTTGHKPLAVP